MQIYFIKMTLKHIEIYIWIDYTNCMCAQGNEQTNRVKSDTYMQQ